VFDYEASPHAAVGSADIDDAAVVDTITSAARGQNALCARELAAIGELYARRAPDDDADRINWAIDGHENVVAEVSAALGISRGRARGRLRYAIALRERLPRVAEVFAAGAIDFRLMAAVVCRTELVEEPRLVAELDAAIARHAPTWGRLSEPKLFERIDMWVLRIDPAGTRVPGARNQDRYVEIGPTGEGLAGMWAQLHAPDGVALDHKLDALSGTVCPADPRTKAQRRADALGALAAGLDEMRCQCGLPDCSAAQRRPGTDVVIHVLAEQATLGGDADTPGYLPGFGPLPVTALRSLATTAKVKPAPKPSVVSVPRMRPAGPGVRHRSHDPVSGWPHPSLKGQVALSSWSGSIDKMPGRSTNQGMRCCLRYVSCLVLVRRAGRPFPLLRSNGRAHRGYSFLPFWIYSADDETADRCGRRQA
jgi:hypothetical protein